MKFYVNEEALKRFYQSWQRGSFSAWIFLAAFVTVLCFNVGFHFGWIGFVIGLLFSLGVYYQNTVPALKSSIGFFQKVAVFIEIRSDQIVIKKVLISVFKGIKLSQQEIELKIKNKRMIFKEVRGRNSFRKYTGKIYRLILEFEEFFVDENCFSDFDILKYQIEKIAENDTVE
jgi:hypothetical protein